MVQLLRKNASPDCPKLHVLIDEAQHGLLSDVWSGPAQVPFMRLVGEVIKPRAIIAGASKLSVDKLEVVEFYGPCMKYVREGTTLFTSTKTWPDGSTKNGVHDQMLRYCVLDHLPELLNIPGLLERIEKWLSCRPRFIATLLQLYMQAEKLLGDHNQIPYHKILSEAFRRSTGFQPRDGIIFEGIEGELPQAITELSFEYGTMTVCKRFERGDLDEGK